MKCTRSPFVPALVGLMFMGFLLVGMPEAGQAQPHTCKHDLSGHWPLSPTGLGGVATFEFWFAKSCPTNSNALSLTWYINRYSDNSPICTGSADFTSTSNPPYVIKVTCNGLPIGNGPQVKVTLSYVTSPGGSPMNHPDNFYNHQ